MMTHDHHDVYIKKENMGKVIRLTEGDIQRIVKRVLNEQLKIATGIKSDGQTHQLNYKELPFPTKKQSTALLIGALTYVGGKLMKNMIEKKRGDKLEKLIGDVNIKLQQSLTDAEYNCILNKLTSVLNRVSKLTTGKNDTQTKLHIMSCVGNDETRVEKIIDLLDTEINKLT